MQRKTEIEEFLRRREGGGVEGSDNELTIKSIVSSLPFKVTYKNTEHNYSYT